MTRELTDEQVGILLRRIAAVRATFDTDPARHGDFQQGLNAGMVIAYDHVTSMIGDLITLQGRY